VRRPPLCELGWHGVLRWYSLDDPLHLLLSLRCFVLGHRWEPARTTSGGHRFRRCRWYGLHREILTDQDGNAAK
jgi:hypothetical protein